MTSVAISQPTFLPWLGYIALIMKVDTFVYLDDVQFDKRSWQQRNKIKTSNGVNYLIVPVFSKGKKDQHILSTKIDYSKCLGLKQNRAIECSYRKSPYYDWVYPVISELLLSEYNSLADLNITLIEAFLNLLSIKTIRKRSSELNADGAKASRLLNICNCVGATMYYSTIGSKTYLDNSEEFKSSSIKLIYHDFKHPRYQQLHGDFIPYLSILDLLMNEGEKAKDILNNALVETYNKK